MSGRTSARKSSAAASSASSASLSPTRTTKSTEQRGGGSSYRRGAESIGRIFHAPLFDFHAVIALGGVLTALGLFMVLNASGPRSLSEFGSVYTIFFRQAVFVAVGIVGVYAIVRFRITTLERLSLYTYWFSIALLFAVLVVGDERNGARSWIDLGPLSFQPSEFAKLAYALYGAHLVAQRLRNPAGTRVGEVLVPVLGYGSLVLILIVLQKDLGMAIAIALVVVALLWFSRVPFKLLGSVFAALTVLAGAIIATTSFRSDRLQTWLSMLRGHIPESGYQARQGLIALVEGGFSGVGFGQSRAKHYYLPEANNDFIFAIIGEEGGFVAAALVIILFALLMLVGIRIAQRNRDPFLTLLAGVTVTATVAQAFINIAYVLGLLPVTGLQLPLISSGGTSAIMTLAALALLATAARNEPEAVAAIRSGNESAVARFLRLPTPEIYSGDPERDGRRPTTPPTPARNTGRRSYGRTPPRDTGVPVARRTTGYRPRQSEPPRPSRKSPPPTQGRSAQSRESTLGRSRPDERRRGGNRWR